MMLNRDNYEMYFLLYIDNELDAVQRGEVEDFISAHPDLALELADLQNTLLTEEAPLVFPDKELLYRQTDKETALLLYVDNELSITERAALEQECAASPELQRQLQQLQQAVLSQESIVFENKESLYRRERTRIIPISIFYRRALSVAAVLACVAITGWWLLNRAHSTTPVAAVTATEEGAQTSPFGQDRHGYDERIAPSSHAGIGQHTIATNSRLRQQIPSASSEVDIDPASPSTTVLSGDQAPLLASSPKSSSFAKPIKTQQLTTSQQALVSKQPGSTPQTMVAGSSVTSGQAVTAQRVNGQSAPQRGGLIQPGTQREATIVPEPQTILTQLPEQNATEVLTAMTPAVQKTPASIVKPAVYKELDMTEEGNESLYIGSLELNKNKVAGLFRRAGRLFGSKAGNTEKNL